MTDEQNDATPLHVDAATSDAAAGAPPTGTRATETARPRRRLSWRVGVPVITAVAGLMFAMSFAAAQGRDLRADRDLPELILDGDARVSEQAARLDVLQKEVDRLAKASAPSDRRLATLTAKGDAMSAEAAATPVSGPAIEVTLDDAHRTGDTLPDNVKPDDVVVHQQDVQGVVNALWQSGAEAMMIQDQRIISTSAVRCVGNTLILQGRVYSPPYRITAIGDVQSMQLGLDNDRTVSIYRDYVDFVGLGYEVRTRAAETFPAYSGTVDLQYASPVR